MFQENILQNYLLYDFYYWNIENLIQNLYIQNQIVYLFLNRIFLKLELKSYSLAALFEDENWFFLFDL